MAMEAWSCLSGEVMVKPGMSKSATLKKENASKRQNKRDTHKALFPWPFSARSALPALGVGNDVVLHVLLEVSPVVNGLDRRFQAGTYAHEADPTQA